MNELQQVVADLRAEGEELHRLLGTLREADWSRATRFKRWTIADVVAHLYFGDYLGITSHRDADEFRAFMASVQHSGLTLADFTRQWLDGLSGPPLLAKWYDQFDAMCTLFAASDPGLRLAWAGPSMGIRMFATARLMETWAHGWAIYDLLGVSRTHTDRIRHIATLGARTYGWTFANRGLPEPGPAPWLVLEAPSGALGMARTPAGQPHHRLCGGVLPGGHPGAQHRRHRPGSGRRAGARLDGHRPMLRRAAGSAARTGHPPLRRAPVSDGD